jgi:hypothetical protein
LYNKELHTLYFSPNILGCVGHVASMGEGKSIHCFNGCAAGKELHGKLGIDGG